MFIHEYMSVLGSPKGPMSSNCAIHRTYIRAKKYHVLLGRLRLDGLAKQTGQN